MGKQKPKYSDEQRAELVAMMIMRGYPDNPHAALEVSKYSSVPTRTLRRWADGDNNPPPVKLVTQKKGELSDALEGVVWQMVDHIKSPDVIGDMSGQQTATSIGIMIDKIRLLRGLPTEIVQILPEVVSAIESMGQKPSDVFQRIIQRAKEHANTGRNS